MGLLIIIFYLIGSNATHFKREIKQKQEESGTERGAVQVLANTILLLILSCYSWIRPDALAKTSQLALAGIACQLGDTLASEIGSAISSTPILIITLQKAKPGQNGAVSLPGTLASIAGGFIMGIAYIAISFIWPYYLYVFPVHIILLTSSFCGLVGSLIDSILGATLQATWFDTVQKKIVCKKTKDSVLIGGMPLLSNEMVNFLSSILTCLVLISLSN
jgi:uncharacterized protein (TIGR00297 family)